MQRLGVYQEAIIPTLVLHILAIAYFKQRHICTHLTVMGEIPFIKK